MTQKMAESKPLSPAIEVGVQRLSGLEILLMVWIFVGVMGKLIPVFFIPVVKSLRPHFFVALIMAGLIPLNFLYSKYNLGSFTSLSFLSLMAWVGFIGVSAVSFVNLKPMEVLIYPREGGTDSLLAKWVFMIVLLLLMIYAHNMLRSSKHIIKNIVNVIDKSFIIYFIVGWPLYIAAVLGKISRATYFLFTIQFNILESVTLLRFCPGDYPNGTGEMLGFYIIFILYMRRYIKYVPLKLMVGTGSLIITTTRASIIPVFIILALFSIYIIVFKLGSFKIYKIKTKSLFAILLLVIWIVVLLFSLKEFEAINQRAELLYSGVVNITQSKSVQTRYEYWGTALDIFSDTMYMGDGFAKYLETHNVILQLLAEVGVAGALFYVVFIGLRILATVSAYFQNGFRKTGIEADFIRMLVYAIPVNALFTLTNHNLFHFTFWLLCIATFIVEPRLTVGLPDKDLLQGRAKA